MSEIRSRCFDVRWQFFLVSLIYAGLSGCGQESWQAKTYPVTGSVMINGAPAAGVFIRLLATGALPVDKRESVPWGEVGVDGTFTIRTYVKGDGAPVGEYAIALQWPHDPSAVDTVDRLKGAFSSKENAPVRVVIEKKRNELAPIVLNDVKVIPISKQ